MTTPKESLQSIALAIRERRNNGEQNTGNNGEQNTAHFHSKYIYVMFIQQKSNAPWYVTIIVYTDTVQHPFDLHTLRTLKALEIYFVYLGIIDIKLYYLHQCLHG